MSYTYYSLGAIRRKDLPTARGKDGCLAMVLEPDGRTWTYLVSDGEQWVEDERPSRQECTS